MESTIEQLSNQTAPDLQGIDNNSFAIIDIDKQVAILQKEIEVLKLEISEIKESNKNPLQ